MLRFFPALLQPAPTSRFDPYRWRRDNRTTGRKVLDGIRLAGGLVTGFVVLMMALVGVATQPAVGTRYSQHWTLLSWTMLCLATVTLFLTANRWAPVGPAFFCVPGSFKALGVLIVGADPSSSIAYHRMTRMQAGETLFFCIIVIALTWRFAGNRPAPTTFIDRVALTFFVLATLKHVVTPYKWPPVPLISGLFALLIAWLAYRWQSVGIRRKHRRPQGHQMTASNSANSRA